MFASGDGNEPFPGVIRDDAFTSDVTVVDRVITVNIIDEALISHCRSIIGSPGISLFNVELFDVEMAVDFLLF